MRTTFPDPIFGTHRLATRCDATPVMFSEVVEGAWLHWTVVEIDARMVPGSHGARCLIFAQQNCIRRVWQYPNEWRALDDAGLVELSRHR